MITGWLGYTWSHVAVACVQAWYTVYLIDNLSDSSLTVLSDIHALVWESNVLFDEIDIKNYRAIEWYFAKHHEQISCIIHCAHLKSLNEQHEDSFAYYANNIQWTLNILKAMNVHNISNIVYHSYSWLYDTHQTVPPYHEKDSVKPSNAFTTSKHICEQILLDIATRENINVCILRIAKVIGMHPSGELGKITMYVKTDTLANLYWAAAWFWDGVTLIGSSRSDDRTYAVDYVHIQDVGSAFVAAVKKLSSQTKFSCICNIGSGGSITQLQLLAIVEKVTGTTIPYEINQEIDDYPRLLNITLAEKILWWSPTHTVQQAINDGRRYIKRHHLRV